MELDGAARHLNRARLLGEPYSLDTLYQLYSERIGALGLDPPGPDWDGAYVALSK